MNGPAAPVLASHHSNRPATTGIHNNYISGHIEDTLVAICGRAGGCLHCPVCQHAAG
jgi:hypothetical protein